MLVTMCPTTQSLQEYQEHRIIGSKSVEIGIFVFTKSIFFNNYMTNSVQENNY